MKKMLSLFCVIGWLTFWTFGWIALGTDVTEGQMATSMGFAAVGLFAGIFSWLKLLREGDKRGWQRVYQSEN